MREIIEAWQGKKALVIGDPMRDVYCFGRVDRVSQEAPVPVFVTERTEERRGGADNVAANLKALGLDVNTFFPLKPWITKTRYMVGHHQLFRVDHDIQYPGEFTHEYEETEFDVIVISDYAKGWCSEAKCRAVIEAANCPVVVDPKGTDWSKYQGATVICPNESEWGAVHCQQPDGTVVFSKHGDKGLAVITKDKDGTQRALLFPAQAKHVYDVTGAGDTVVAVVAACLSVGAPYDTAARLAASAAGYVVGEVGTAPCSKEQLICALGLPMAAGTSSMRDTSTSSPSAGNTASTSSSPSTQTPTVSGLKEWNAHTTLSLHELPTSGPWPKRSSHSKDGRKL